MRVIACCKAAPEEQDIVVNGDGTLSFERAAWKFGSYDLNAVEAGRQLVEQVGGEVIGLTVGGEALASAKLRKDIISRGLDSLNIVTVAGSAVPDTLQTAQLLAAGLGKVGSYDLVLCGAGSSDEYTQQVGNQLGALLGIPTLNAINSITPNGTTVTVERVLENEVQTLEVTLPAVLSLTSGANTPRIAGMKDILAAGKKETTETTAAALGVDTTTVSAQVSSVVAPKQTARQRTILEGDVAEVTTKLIELIGADLR
ncbi:MAG: putative electron transfer flavoprotein FixA [Coriobacteriales bacterium]|jgi:electron transfer flavoprotein beta subunit|nr:putative electron transfer flavoprotein FixA [Coriobacteriales bacterium]